MVEKLNFSWDEVHEIAEELEHIKSEVLINKLDQFLGFPSFYSHGHPFQMNRELLRKLKNTYCLMLKLIKHTGALV